MAGLIRQEDVDAVRERTDIVKVVSAYLQLKKAGHDRFVGLCPFHSEKTPSFSVSPSKQAYYCFGCGEGGTVFGFLQKLENLSFPEVVERLAKEAGVQLRYEGESPTARREAGRRELLHRANAEAGRLYGRMLLEGREATEARAYLAERGVSQASVERFGIGYAPGYSDFLLRRMNKTFSPEILVEAGLVAKDPGGALRDRFRGRVVFPIHDLSGNAVGFGGRLLVGPTKPGAEAPSGGGPAAAKYVNSPETPVYHKGSLLYNLNRAKAEVTRTGRVFLVEGYTDVIALDQAGVPTAVATCGTALGEEHLRLLSRFTDRAVLAFDSDEAGARAAERAYQFHQRYPVDVMVLILPAGQDPADFVLAHGRDSAQGPQAGEAFLGLAERATPLVEYMITRALRGRDLADGEEQVRAVRDGLAYVAPLDDPVRRARYAAVVADHARVPSPVVMEELQRIVTAAGGAPESATGAGRSTLSRRSPHEKVEREALKLMVQAAHLVPEQVRALDAERFSTPSYRKTFEFLRETEVNGGGAAVLVARAHERGEQLGRLLAALAVEPTAAVGEPTRDYAAAVFLRLEEFWLTRRIDALRKEIQVLNPQKVPEEYETLFGRLVSLEGERRRIRVEAESVGSSV